MCFYPETELENFVCITAAFCLSHNVSNKVTFDWSPYRSVPLGVDPGWGYLQWAPVWRERASKCLCEAISKSLLHWFILLLLLWRTQKCVLMKKKMIIIKHLSNFCMWNMLIIFIFMKSKKLDKSCHMGTVTWQAPFIIYKSNKANDKWALNPGWNPTDFLILAAPLGATGRAGMFVHIVWVWPEYQWVSAMELHLSCTNQSIWCMTRFFWPFTDIDWF